MRKRRAGVHIVEVAEKAVFLPEVVRVEGEGPGDAGFNQLWSRIAPLVRDAKCRQAEPRCRDAGEPSRVQGPIQASGPGPVQHLSVLRVCLLQEVQAAPPLHVVQESHIRGRKQRFWRGLRCGPFASRLRALAPPEGLAGQSSRGAPAQPPQHLTTMHRPLLLPNQYHG